MIAKYAFRFYPCNNNQKLYTAIRTQSVTGGRLTLSNTSFMTVPFKSKTTNEERNTLVGFTSPELALNFITRNVKNNNDTAVVHILADELTHVADIMHMPFLVVLNAYCHLETKEDWVYDVYLRPEKDDNNSTLPKIY